MHLKQIELSFVIFVAYGISSNIPELLNGSCLKSPSKPHIYITKFLFVVAVVFAVVSSTFLNDNDTKSFLIDLYKSLKNCPSSINIYFILLYFSSDLLIIVVIVLSKLCSDIALIL